MKTMKKRIKKKRIKRLNKINNINNNSNKHILETKPSKQNINKNDIIQQSINKIHKYEKLQY